MSKKTNIVLIIVSIIIVIVAITGGTYAYWSGKSEIGIDNANNVGITFEDNTYKYLIIQATTNISGKNYYIYLEYDDSVEAFNQSSTDYNSRYNEERKSISEVTGDLTDLTVIGYKGYLGEYETVNIPESIYWRKDSSSQKKICNIEKINFQTPEEFPSLNNIKSISIPENVKYILGVSFVNWGNLNSIYFKAETEIPSKNIGEYTIFADPGLKPLNSVAIYYNGIKTKTIDGIRG